MEDENQRRTWEYLQGVSRKEGSYGKILSEAFVATFDGRIQSEADKTVNDSLLPLVQDTNALEKMLEKKSHEIFQELQKALTKQISNSFKEYASDFHSGKENTAENSDADGMGQMQEAELSEDMMAFAFAMGE